MSRFILVHGAWHGAWCWNKVTPLLEERGHTVVTPTLPLEQGLDAYVTTVSEAVDSAPDSSILVGHSMAGAVVSQVAELLPDKIERLVFLTAFAPQNGESINAYARVNIASALRDNVVPGEGGAGVVVKPAVIRDCFYHDCSDEDVAWAIEQLRPQNPSPFETVLTLTAERYGTVSKQYIECVEDQAIHIHLQRVMARRAGCTLVNSLQTSHSPFMSAPAQLVAHLATIGINDARKP